MCKKDDRLVIIPLIDMSQFNFKLALPTKQNTYGFRYLHRDNPAYSPIDLAVAGVTAFQEKNPIRKLHEFFNSHKYRQSEDSLVLGIISNGTLLIKSITDWKHYISENESPHIRKILKDNAPLTFREF